MTFTTKTYQEPAAYLNDLEARIKAAFDALPAPTPAGPLIQAKRAPVPALASGSPNYVDVAVTWTTPFADTNYTVVPGVEEDVSPGYYTAFVKNVLAKTKTGCKVRVQTNGPALTAGQATLHVIAVAD